jgi:hypothetical protein
MHMPCYDSKTHTHRTYTIFSDSAILVKMAQIFPSIQFLPLLSFHQCTIFFVPLKSVYVNPVTSMGIPTQSHATCCGHCKYIYCTQNMILLPSVSYNVITNELMKDIRYRWDLQNDKGPSSNSYTRNTSKVIITKKW